VNILIIGAGAVGQYLGGKLSAAGQNIAFIEKSKEKIDFINKHKITIKDGDKDYLSRSIKAYYSFSDIPIEKADFDYIFLCVKAYHLKSVIEEIITFVDRAKVVVFQNGIGNEECAAEYFILSSVISATSTTAVYIGDDNIVYASGKGGIGIAPVNEPARTRAHGNVPLLYDVFQDSGFNVKSYNNYKSLKWSKLLINMIGNAVVAVLDMPSVDVFSDKNMVNLEIEAFREGVKVAKKLNVKLVDLPGFPVSIFAKAFFYLPFFMLKPFLKKKIAVSRGNKKPSLQIELLLRSGNTENEYINGAVFNEAQKLGLNAPANKAIYDALEDIVKNENWEYYRNKPEVLWRLYEKHS